MFDFTHIIANVFKPPSGGFLFMHFLLFNFISPAEVGLDFAFILM